GHRRVCREESRRNVPPSRRFLKMDRAGSPSSASAESFNGSASIREVHERLADLLAEVDAELNSLYSTLLEARDGGGVRDSAYFACMSAESMASTLRRARIVVERLRTYERDSEGSG